MFHFLSNYKLGSKAALFSPQMEILYIYRRSVPVLIIKKDMRLKFHPIFQLVLLFFFFGALEIFSCISESSSSPPAIKYLHNVNLYFTIYPMDPSNLSFLMSSRIFKNTKRILTVRYRVVCFDIFMNRKLSSHICVNFIMAM